MAFQREALDESHVIAGLKYRVGKCKNNPNMCLIAKKENIQYDPAKSFK